MGHFTHFSTFSVSCYSTFIYLIGKKIYLSVFPASFFFELLPCLTTVHYLKKITFFIFTFLKFNYSFVHILPSHLLAWTSCSRLSRLFHQFLSSFCYKQFNKTVSSVSSTLFFSSYSTITSKHSEILTDRSWSSIMEELSHWIWWFMIIFPKPIGY